MQYLAGTIKCVCADWELFFPSLTMRSSQVWCLWRPLLAGRGGGKKRQKQRCRQLDKARIGKGEEGRRRVHKVFSLREKKKCGNPYSFLRRKAFSAAGSLQSGSCYLERKIKDVFPTGFLSLMQDQWRGKRRSKDLLFLTKHLKNNGKKVSGSDEAKTKKTPNIMKLRLLKEKMFHKAMDPIKTNWTKLCIRRIPKLIVCQILLQFCVIKDD